MMRSSITWLLLGAALLCVAAYHVSLSAFGLRVFDLGSIQFLSLGYGYAVGLWTFWGGAAVAFAAFALARMRPASGAPSLPMLESDRTWIALGCAFGFLLPLYLHGNVLLATRISDDEAMYLFSAELLASGRLYGESHPERWFFQRIFMVNDGKLYSQYFLGWPALLAPGVWLSVPGLMNPLYTSLTVPALYRSVQLLSSTFAARVAVMLFVTSPMVLIAGGTLLSHTTTFCALAWALYCFTRTQGDRSHVGWHAGLALAIAAAFFIRPQTALGLGSPLVVLWLLRVRTHEKRGACASAFAVPALTLGALFFYVNHAQTGSPLVPAMKAALDHARDNNQLFGHGAPGGTAKLPDIRFDLVGGFGTLSAGLVRMSHALFAWPSSFLLLPLAIGAPRIAPLAWMSGVYLTSQLLVSAAGIDTFAPVHFYELSLPVIVLSAVGIARARAFARERAQVLPERLHWLAALPMATLVALILLAPVGHTPILLRTVERIATAVRAPEDIVRSAGIQHAVLFGTRPYSPCLALPTRHFVFWAPAYDPDLKNDLLWVNHLTTELDRKLMREHFPDRKGYYYQWAATRCELELIPLDDPRADTIPPNRELPKNFTGK